MNIKKAGMIPACIFAAVVFAAALLCLAADGSPALRIGRLPESTDAVNRFFDSYKAGDFETMDSMLYGYETLGLSSEYESEFTSEMFDIARESFSFETGGSSAEGNKATVSATVKYIDIPASAETLHELVNAEMVEALKHPPENVDINEKDDVYYNELVLPSLEKAVEKLGDSVEEHMTEKDIELELVYSDGMWRVCPDDELKSLLLGGAA